MSIHRSISLLMDFILITGFILTVPAVSAQSTDSGPIAGTTHQSMKLLQQENLRRTVIDVFNSQYDEGISWYADGLQSLEMYVKIAADMPDKPRSSAMREVALKAIEAGCEDAMVIFAAARGTAHGRKAAALILKVHEVLEDSPYGSSQRLEIYMRSSERMVKTGKLDESQEYLRNAIDTAVQLVKESDSGSEMSRFSYSQIQTLIDKREVDPEATGQMCRTIMALKEGDPWLKNIVFGNWLIEEAWRKRTAKLGRDVTEEGWKGFYKNLNEAYFHLDSAHRMSPQRPEAATELITSSMGGSSLPGRTPRYWFEQATKAQIDWMPAYHSFSWALRPRWGGSNEAMYDFARECMKTKRYDTQVPFMYLEIMRDLAEDVETLDVFSSPVIYHEAYSILREYAKLPDSASRPKNKKFCESFAAVLACFAHEYEQANEHWQNSSRKIDGRACSFFGISGQLMEAEIAAYASPQGKYLRDADIALDAGNIHDADDLYRMALDERLQGEPLGEYAYGKPDIDGFIFDRLQTVGLAVEMEKGSWVDLTFNQRLSGWEPVYGNWRMLDERTIRGIPSKKKYRTLTNLFLAHKMPVGSRFEIRGEYDLRKLKTTKDKNAGIMVHAWVGYKAAFYQAIRFNESRHAAYVYKGYGNTNKYKTDIPLQAPFHIKIWDGIVSVNLDGQQLCVDRLSQEIDRMALGNRFGIGGYYTFRDKEVIFRNLGIRKLDSVPQEIRNFEIEEE